MKSKTRLLTATVLLSLLLLGSIGTKAAIDRNTVIKMVDLQPRGFFFLPETSKLTLNGEHKSQTAVLSVDCENLPDDSDPGQKIKCKAKDFAEAACNTAAISQKDLEGLFSAKDQESLQENCDLATAWADQTPAEDFKLMGMKQRTTCAVVEIIEGDLPENNDNDDTNDIKIIGDEDGICSKQELNKGGCLEVVDDGIGDDDGICEKWPEKGGQKFWEPCAESCTLETLEEDDENFNEVRLAQMEIGLEQTTELLDQANQEVVELSNTLMTVQSAYSENDIVSDPKTCRGLLTADLGGGTFGGIYHERPKNYSSLQDYLIGFWAGQLAADICSDVAGQTAMGWNTVAVCAVVHTAEAALGTAFESMELLDDAITGTRIDNAVQCLETLGGQFKETKSTLDNKVEFRRLHFQVLEIKEKQEFLISVTEFGMPVTSQQISTFSVNVADKADLIFLPVNFSHVEIADGVYLLTLNLPKEIKNADIFMVEVADTHYVEDDVSGEVNTFEHYGLVIFDRSEQNTISTGQ